MARVAGILPAPCRGHLALESQARCLRHARAGRPRHRPPSSRHPPRSGSATRN